MGQKIQVERANAGRRRPRSKEAPQKDIELQTAPRIRARPDPLCFGVCFLPWRVPTDSWGGCCFQGSGRTGVPPIEREGAGLDHLSSKDRYQRSSLALLLGAKKLPLKVLGAPGIATRTVREIRTATN